MFSFIPPIRIVGEYEDSPDSDVAETVKVTPYELKVSVPELIASKHNCPTTFRIFAFNKDHMHENVDPEILPYELMGLSSVEMFEFIAKKIDSYVVFYGEEHPMEGYLRFFLGEYLPFAIRSARKTLYERVFQMLPVSGEFFAPLEQSGEPFEEYIENALMTYRDYVLEPTRMSVEEALEFGTADLQRTEVLRGSVMKALDRVSDLISIVSERLFSISERSRGFTRIVLPLLHSYTLRSHLKDYTEIYLSSGRISLKIDREKEVPAKTVFEAIQDLLRYT